MTLLKRAIAQAAQLERSAHGILVEKKVVSDQAIDPSISEALRTKREAVAAIIVPESWGNFIDHPLDLPVMMGIGGMNKDALEFMGGGLDSDQELQIKTAHANGEEVDERLLVNGAIPQHLFFLMQGKHLLEKGELLRCTFDTRAGLRAILERELKREIAEEAGEKAKAAIVLQEVFDASPKQTNLITASFGPFTKGIAEKYTNKGLTLNEAGKLSGLAVTIEERGMLAIAEDFGALEHIAEQTEEVRGLMSITLGELFARGEKATQNIESWNTYGFGKPRNDSVFYLAKSLLEHMSKR